MQSYFFLLFAIAFPIVSFAQTNNFNKKLNSYISTLTNEFDQIPLERRETLNELGQFILSKQRDGLPASITFVSRYNAERTQLCQIWLDAAAKYYQMNRVNAFSAGFVPKQFSTRVADALKRAGFLIEKLNGAQSPTFQTKTNKKSPSIIGYSKHYSNSLIPKADYVAVFVQEQALDEIEMLSKGSIKKVHLDYLKPYEFKEKKFEVKEYNAICRTIGREMLYVISMAKIEQGF